MTTRVKSLYEWFGGWGAINALTESWWPVLGAMTRPTRRSGRP